MYNVAILDKVSYSEKPCLLQFADGVLCCARSGLGYKEISFNNGKEETHQRITNVFLRVLCTIFAFTVLAVPTLIALALKVCAKKHQEKYLEKINAVTSTVLPATSIEKKEDATTQPVKDKTENKLPPVTVSSSKQKEGSTQPNKIPSPNPDPVTVPSPNQKEGSTQPSKIPSPTPNPVTDKKEQSITQPLKDKPEDEKPSVSATGKTEKKRSVHFADTVDVIDLLSPKIEQKANGSSDVLSPDTKKKKGASTPFSAKKQRVEDKKKHTLPRLTPLDLQIADYENLEDALSRKSIDDIMHLVEEIASFMDLEIEMEKIGAEFLQAESLDKGEKFCKKLKKEFDVTNMIKSLKALKEFAKTVLHPHSDKEQILELFREIMHDHGHDFAEEYIVEKMCDRNKILSKNPNYLDLECVEKVTKLIESNPKGEDVYAICAELLGKGIAYKKENSAENSFKEWATE